MPPGVPPPRADTPRMITASGLAVLSGGIPVPVALALALPLPLPVPEGPLEPPVWLGLPDWLPPLTEAVAVELLPGPVGTEVIDPPGFDPEPVAEVMGPTVPVDED